MTSFWTRRRWLTHQGLTMAALRVSRSSVRRSFPGHTWVARHLLSPDVEARMAAQAARIDPAPWQALAQQAVDAARTAGARYADAHLTRIVMHEYSVGAGRNATNGSIIGDVESLGVGVRALVDGYWGFSASTILKPDETIRLARDAVAQAKENAKGPPRPVELGTIPVATGTWATPIRIDPFTIPIQEKKDFIESWAECYNNSTAGVPLTQDGFPSWLSFARQERVVATSEGSLFTQTLYESAGEILINNGDFDHPVDVPVHGIDRAGAGWELFLDADIPNQIPQIKEELQRRGAIPSKPSTIGRYTLVCDGATMAALLEQTLGVATQLDRALGYEANASGTSFLDDPLAMVGNFPVAVPSVTVTANRSAPRELATVKWDEEGVEPHPVTLVKDGVLTDFQTTREQAAWLAPYYQKLGRPVRSNGCAAAEDAHLIPMQHMPNLALEPSPQAIRLEDLVANVADGILIEGGTVMETDSQVRTGLLMTEKKGRMRQIKNGQVGPQLISGAVLYDSQALWHQILAIGGPSTTGVIHQTQYTNMYSKNLIPELRRLIKGTGCKGQPQQVTSHSVRAAAATIANQPLISPSRKT